MRRPIFFVLCLSFLLACENDLDEVNKLFEELQPGTEVAREVEILYSDSAQVRVVIVSPVMERYLDKVKPRDEFPEGLHVDFLDGDGSVESTLDARHGLRFPRDKKIIVRDSVILRSTQFQTLETSELIWDEATAEVYTDKFVKITQGEEIIFAYGFRSNQDFTDWTLLSVRGKYKIDELQREFKN